MSNRRLLAEWNESTPVRFIPFDKLGRNSYTLLPAHFTHSPRKNQGNMRLSAQARGIGKVLYVGHGFFLTAIVLKLPHTAQ
jgi:hypothetical protein